MKHPEQIPLPIELIDNPNQAAPVLLDLRRESYELIKAAWKAAGQCEQCGAYEWSPGDGPAKRVAGIMLLCELCACLFSGRF
jgi:hypothetical protein